MIEEILNNLDWAIVPPLEDFPAPRAQNIVTDADAWPDFERITIFVTVERGRRGPGNEFRLWAIGFPADPALRNMVLATLRVSQDDNGFWAIKAAELHKLYKADYVVGTEDGVVLALYLAGIPKAVSLRGYFQYLEHSALPSPALPSTKAVCKKCGYAEGAAIHSLRHPGRHDFQSR